jgi:hypothetical protein
MARKRKPLEKSVQKSVIEHARKYGLLCVKHSGAMGGSSQPDYEVYLPGGSPLLIEFKKFGEQPTPLQAKRIKLLRALKYHVEVIDNTQDGKSLVDGALAKLRCGGSAKVESAAPASTRAKAPAGQSLRSFVARSRRRENVNGAGGIQGAEARKTGKKNAGDRAAESLLPGLAKRAKEMDRLSKPFRRYAPWRSEGRSR